MFYEWNLLAKLENLEIEGLVEDGVERFAVHFGFELLLLVGQQVDLDVRVRGAAHVQRRQVLGLVHRHRQIALSSPSPGPRVNVEKRAMLSHLNIELDPRHRLEPFHGLFLPTGRNDLNFGQAASNGQVSVRSPVFIGSPQLATDQLITN